MMHSGELPSGSQGVFWHTGGLLNLVASGVASWEALQ